MKKVVIIILALVIYQGNQAKAQMAGTYTIGPAGDYTNFNAAIAALVAQGVSAPVVFDVAAGTYNEQVSIPAITGASVANTITFQSASGDSTQVVLSYAASDVNNNYTLRFNGADHVSFKKITLQATGTAYARVVAMTNKSDSCAIENAVLRGVSNLDELVYVYSTTSDENTGNTFSNNRFELGKIGINYLGMAGATGVQVKNNIFSNQTEKGMYISYCDGAVISGNRISATQSIDGIFIQDTGIRNLIVNNNEIVLDQGGRGIVGAFELTGPSHPGEESLIYNNFIYINTTTDTDLGIYIYASVVAKIYYNTIHIAGHNSGATVFKAKYMSSPMSIDIKNNILVNEAQGPIYAGDNMFGADYNNLYTNGQYIAYSAETLAEWQNTYNKDQYSVFADPYFVSDNSWQVQNPVVNNAATPVIEVTTDIEGEPRDVANPDLGADEFTPAPVPLNGTYTIGGTSPDYATVKAAVEDVVINGVNGPVVFNIASGTYNEQVSIPEIAGASATNTITFQAASGDANDVIIAFTPANTTYRHTLQFNGADYLIFRNLSVTSGELWGIVIHLQNQATHNRLEGNRIYKSTPAPNSWDYALVYSKGSADSSNVFSGNNFENGNMGIHLDGGGSGTQIIDNTFDNLVFMGIYLKNNPSPIITGNTINIATDLNYVNGIYLYGSTYDGTHQGIIANNMIIINSSANNANGLSLPGSSHLLVAYNSVKVTAAGDGNRAFKGGSTTTILNNIFTLYGSQYDYTAELADTTACEIDYNIYDATDPNRATMYRTGNPGSLGFWQQTYGFDWHSLARKPEFVSATDLHTTDPWISNKGTPVTGLTTDIDGELRDANTPDIGADEYIAATLFAGEYTIGPTGDFATFTDAADSLVKTGAIGPVTFKVQSGTYDEQFTLKEIPNAGVGDSITVTFKPAVAGDSTVILQYAGTAGKNYVLLLDSADYTHFEGITFKALDTTNSTIIYLAHGATHNVFADNIFIGSPNGGPIVYANSEAVNDNDNHFAGNRFYNGNIAINLEGVADTDKATGLIVSGNRFENQHVGAVILHNQQAPEINGNTVLHPKLIEEKWAAVFLGSCSQGLIANNVIAYQADQLSAGVALSNSDHTGVYYNSIRITGLATDSRCYNEENGSSNNVLINNILSNEARGIGIYATDVSSFTSDYNGFYVTGNHLGYTDAYIDDLATWQSTYGLDQHSVFTNPYYTAATDLHTANPLFNGGGKVLAAISTDLEGNSRDPVAPDIGAYEFSEVKYVLGADTTICRYTAITLDAGMGYDGYSWNTGEVTQSIQTSVSDTSATWYRVTVSLRGNDYTDSLLVTYAGPAINLPDTAGFCQGGTVLLTAGDGNDTYEWSDGSTGPSISVSVAGTYSVKVTDQEGCFDRDTVAVVESAGPAVDLGGDVAFCAGDTLTLDAGGGNEYSYLWNDQSTARTIKVVTGGQYAVTVTDQYGCEGSDDIMVTQNPLPAIDLGADLTVCDGATATLDAGSGFTQYSWSDGTGSPTTIVAVSGTYSVTVWDDNGCANTDSVVVTVNPPFTPTLSITNNELQVDYQTGIEYQWFLNQTFVSFGSYSFAPRQSGDYYVLVTDEYGCQGTTNTVSFSITGITDAARAVYQIYPNPSDGNFKIYYPGEANQPLVVIFNARGHIVYQSQAAGVTHIREQVVNLHGLAKGVYLLRIRVNGRVYNQKLLIE